MVILIFVCFSFGGVKNVPNYTFSRPPKELHATDATLGYIYIYKTLIVRGWVGGGGSKEYFKDNQFGIILVQFLYRIHLLPLCHKYLTLL